MGAHHFLSLGRFNSFGFVMRADLCGFPSLEHLSHLFTARFGQSMTEYRAAQRGGNGTNAE